MDTSETIGEQDPDTIESTDPTDTPDTENATDAPEQLYERAIGEWGPAAQVDKATEEAAELAAACARRQNGLIGNEALAAEIADVEIMLEQLRLLVGNDPVDAARANALAELEQRLDAAAGDDTASDDVATDGGPTQAASGPADTPDLDIDPEQRLVDGLEQIRSAAIALEAREDVVLHYYADQAIDPLEQAVTTIQKREGTTGRTQGGDAA